MSSPSMSRRKACPCMPPPLENSTSKSNLTRLSVPCPMLMLLLELRSRPEPRLSSRTQRTGQQLLRPRLPDNVPLLPARAEDARQEPLPEPFERRDAEEQQEVLELHLIPRASGPREPPRREAGLGVHASQVLPERQPYPPGHRRRGGLRHELAQPRRRPHHLSVQQEGVRQL